MSRKFIFYFNKYYWTFEPELPNRIFRNNFYIIVYVYKIQKCVWVNNQYFYQYKGSVEIFIKISVIEKNLFYVNILYKHFLYNITKLWYLW